MVQESLSAVDEMHDLVGSLKLVEADLDASQPEVSLDALLARGRMEGSASLARLDLFGAVVQVIASTVSDLFASETAKLQPIAVAKEVKPSVARWAAALEQLSNATEDTHAIADIVIAKVHEGVACTLPAEAFSANGDCMVVGLLLALKSVNGVAVGLLEGCRRLEVRNAAMNKFIEFLAEEEDDEGEEDEEVEEEKVENDERNAGEDGDQIGSGAPRVDSHACEG